MRSQLLCDWGLRVGTGGGDQLGEGGSRCGGGAERGGGSCRVGFLGEGVDYYVTDRLRFFDDVFFAHHLMN